MWASLTKRQEDHHDLESKGGDQRWQREDNKFAMMGSSQVKKGFIN